MNETPVSRSVRRRLAEQLRLTEAQADGRACIHCGVEHAAMVPMGKVDGVQVFECSPRSSNCLRIEQNRLHTLTQAVGKVEAERLLGQALGRQRPS